MFDFSLAGLTVLAADPVVWASLGTLIAMEIVLGIDTPPKIMSIILTGARQSRAPHKNNARYCSDSPWSATSRPIRSSSSRTRRGKKKAITFRSTKVTMPDQARTTATP